MWVCVPLSPRVCVRVFVQAWVLARVCACMRSGLSCVRACVYARLRVCVCVCVCVCECVCVCVYLFVCVRACVLERARAVFACVQHTLAVHVPAGRIL